MVLVQFIARAGICSRRKAVLLVKDGKVFINDSLVTDPSYRVKPTDKVRVQGNIIKPEKEVYVLLNKPKGYITTVSDEKERKTVLDLVQNAPRARLYPVGRLDRSTTGVLLLTNDGHLAQKLSHPRHGVKKIYQVTVGKTFMSEDMELIRKGFRLYDGFIKADSAEYVPGSSRKMIEVTLHSGKNHIVRRMFEHLEYRVEALDRVEYAGLTKKGIKRGLWRLLSDDEVAALHALVQDKSDKKE